MRPAGHQSAGCPRRKAPARLPSRWSLRDTGLPRRTQAIKVINDYLRPNVGFVATSCWDFFCRRRQAAPPAWLIMLKFTEGGASGPRVRAPSTRHTLTHPCSALLLPGWCLERTGTRTLSRWQHHAGIVDYKNANGRNGRGICCTSDTIDLIGGGQRRPRQGGAPCFSAQHCSRASSSPCHRHACGCNHSAMHTRHSLVAATFPQNTEHSHFP